jgi:hypothetical protein
MLPLVTGQVFVQQLQPLPIFFLFETDWNQLKKSLSFELKKSLLLSLYY